LAMQQSVLTKGKSRPDRKFDFCYSIPVEHVNKWS